MSDSAPARPEFTGPQPLTPAGDSPADNSPPEGGADRPPAARRRRRGSRGGRNRNRSAANAAAQEGPDPSDAGPIQRAPQTEAGTGAEAATRREAPAPSGPSAIGQTPGEGGDRGAAAAPAATPAQPPKPKIGDSRPAPTPIPRVASNKPNGGNGGSGNGGTSGDRRRRRRGGRGSRAADGERRPVEAVLVDEPVEIDDETRERRRGRERKGRPVGRYLMVVQKRETVTQIAVLEGRALIEHYVSRPADDATQIDGNIYLGRVQNVLPGMEAAFVDIGTPKNAVLYRGDVRYDKDDIEGGDSNGGGKGGSPTRGRLSGVARDARIEQLLKTGQTIVCQVTKNPIGTKGARLTQEVSLPGRFVVLIPNSDTYGISKRLPDEERKRLRRILDEVRPAGHGLIVRTAAEGATADELRRDVGRLSQQWDRIDSLSKTARTPALLYREPDMAVRVIREEFNRDYRGVVIDDRALYEEVRDYVASINPELADRVEWAGDPNSPDYTGDPLPVFERYHVHEQIHKALDRKVWLPSGGSLIIERTEALTVIDVNTGKNVGTSNLEETVFRNNLEAAEEIARQLRLRDIGGIIVIDFIDMEIAANRAEVVKRFREALARDKTRTQVFDISELGLVEMTRKRISEGLVESFSETCPTCGGRGIVFDQSLL